VENNASVRGNGVFHLEHRRPHFANGVRWNK